jgi:hypothetical protein
VFTAATAITVASVATSAVDSLHDYAPADCNELQLLQFRELVMTMIANATHTV